MYSEEIKRGDIFWADLGANSGSEQNGIRPVINVQNDIGNRYARTYIVVPLTKRIKGKIKQPTHYIIAPGKNRLRYHSIALTEQIRSIDKSRLIEKIGCLSDLEIKGLDQALKIAEGLKG